MTGDLGLSITSGIQADLKLERNDIALDSGLRTAVILSLFTDARVAADELPRGDTWRRGYWADELSDVINDRHGSKLWLLAREKQTNDVAERAKIYCAEALQWLIEDGIAKSVSVMTEWLSRGTLGIEITIERPGGDRTLFRFDHLWRSLEAGV